MAKKKKMKIETQEVVAEKLQESAPKLRVFTFPPINGGKTVSINALTKKEAIEQYKLLTNQ